MKRSPDILFWTASAGMELSWMYAWAAFLMSAAADRPYPLPEAVALFVLAALVTALSRGRGWRVLGVLALHVAGWTVLALRSVQLWWYPQMPFWSAAWGADLFSRSRASLDWLILTAFLAWTLVWWVWGFLFARRSSAYPEVCTRFDKGLAWLFALLLLKLFMRTQVGVPSGETLSQAMIFPFFVFALPAVALARSRSESHRQFMSGYRGLGLILSFSIAVLFCAAGLVLLFLPYLRAASEIGYEAIKASGRLIGPLIVRILMFIFGYKPYLPANPNAAPKPPPTEILPPGEPSWWTELFVTVCIWFFYILLALLLILFIGVGAWYLGRWLLSRTPRTARGSNCWGRFLQWLESWMGRLQSRCGEWLARRKDPESIRLYGRLLRWGRRSGLPPRTGETPLEYGRRLEGKFSRTAGEIDRIVTLFNLHVYGGIACSLAEAARARRALKRLQSPRLWPKRLKLWFIGN